MIHRLSRVMSYPYVQVQCADGHYWPARPYQDSFRFERLKAAWAVFTGRADAFVWPQQEDAKTLQQVEADHRHVHHGGGQHERQSNSR